MLRLVRRKRTRTCHALSSRGQESRQTPGNFGGQHYSFCSSDIGMAFTDHMNRCLRSQVGGGSRCLITQWMRTQQNLDNSFA